MKCSFLSSALLILGWLAAACGSNDPLLAPLAPDGGPGPSGGADSSVDSSDASSDTDGAVPWEWTPPPAQPTTSSACGTAMPDAVGVDGATASGRAFHVWGPAGYDPNNAYPVVIMFHGWQTNGVDFESWFEMEKYVNNEAFVVYPDAVQTGSKLWDVYGTTDLTFFDDMVKQLGETYCINPSRIFGFGFSYGAIFVHHLGCQRAGYVRAISAGEGSWGGDNIARCGRLPVLVTHRTDDNDELLAWGKATADNWVSINQCTSDTTSEPFMDPTDGVARPCTIHPNCKVPGGTVTFCEDTYDLSKIPGYDPTWNHTVRDAYRTYTWQWFDAFK